MSSPSLLISSWSDGLFVLSPDGPGHEMRGLRVAGLASDGRSGAIAVVDGSRVMRRSRDGEWTELAASEARMTCCLAVDDAIYVGADGPRLFRVRADAPAEPVEGFDDVDGRADWFAGSTTVDGQVMGPPLGVRSLAGSRDGRLLLAGVHVGGIPRSVDGGRTWHPTIDIEWDVHEVCVHPENPDIVIAACAVGLGISEDGGASWTLHPPGSDVTYCSAVAFSGEDILVSVSDGPFASHGTVLRRSIDSPDPLRPAGGGLPDRLDGKVDTGCLASNGTELAVVDRGGNVYVSEEAGHRWTRRTGGIPDPSSALIM